ncbi:MAG: hypothetical protein L0Y54_06680 [Sporichthyaceae bacterium]|nr:hypothetical protein [Sporichthyaceae bacterium]
MTRSIVAYYQDQPARAADLAAAGRRLVREGTVVHAKLASQQMRALARSGDVAGMRSANRAAGNPLARVPDDAPTTGALSIPPASQPPYTATSLLLVGSFNQAAAIAEELLETVYEPRLLGGSAPPSNYARTLLILALARAGRGDLDGAAAAGQAALDAAHAAWPTMALAGRLDQLLTQRASTSAAKAQYHARYQLALARPSGRIVSSAPHHRGRQ